MTCNLSMPTPTGNIEIKFIVEFILQTGCLIHLFKLYCIKPKKTLKYEDDIKVTIKCIWCDYRANKRSASSGLTV